MLFAPFNRTWWKSLVKGEGTEDVLPPGEDTSPEDDSPLELDEEPIRELAPSPREREPQRPKHRPQQRNNQYAAADDDEHDADHDHEPFTHEGQTGELATDDPLAPAFDLERGVPLSQSAHHHHAPAHSPRSNIKSAKEFFNSEILYRFDILEDLDRSELLGSYLIELKGYQGGIWTVVVGEQVEVVNRREDADIVITMHQRDFLELVNGQLNPQLAIFAQKMRVQGDLRRCISFDRLLTPYTD